MVSSVLKGHLKVLFVSPERLCSNAFRNLMRKLRQQSLESSGSGSGGGSDTPLSPVALLCVDEAHCLSQWSYNFRPAFLRMRREITLLRPTAVLALTATAPPHVQRDVMMHLGIESEGLLSLPPKRPNLSYRATLVHSQQQRREALVKLLCGEGAGVGGASARRSRPDGGGRGRGGRGAGGRGPGSGAGSQSWRRGKGFEDSTHSASTGNKIDKALVDPTIVYVFRRDEAESLAEFLEAAGLPAVPYHAGMDADARAKVDLHLCCS